MSADSGKAGRGLEAVAGMSGGQWRQVVVITLGALGLYVGFRALPTGTNLNHVDFRVSGANALEMCDPANPQFIPVVAMRSPVTMTVRTSQVVRAGGRVSGVVALATAGGKTIGPADLLVMHTRRLHLLIVDPSLTDYQHVHPEPGAREGEWSFEFRPRRAGVYRIFGDFTPAATGRGLYASVDLEVAGPVEAGSQGEVSAAGGGVRSGAVRAAGLVFSLEPVEAPLRVGRAAELVFAVTREGGGQVALEPVMDAYAHLVAFDVERSGFAHLHPNVTEVGGRPDEVPARLRFKVTIPQAGRYAIWTQVKIGGREEFAPFWFEVVR